MPQRRLSFIGLNPRPSLVSWSAMLAAVAAFTMCAVAPCTAIAVPVRAQAEPPSADEVVAKVRAALGIQQLSGAKAVKLLAKGAYLGSPTETTLAVDAAGRFARSVQGPIDMAWSFDAKDLWTRDLGGEVYRVLAGDRRDAIFNAYALSGYFFSPAANLAYSLAPAGEGEPPAIIILADSRPIRVEIDPATSLPRGYRADEGGHARTIEIAEWREQAGLRIPARATLSADSVSEPYEVVRVEIVDRAPDEAFTRPEAGVAHATFDPAAPAILGVERAPTGHLLVRAAINGQDCGWFIFDTGAGINCVSKAVAERLSLQPVGSVPARGVGGVTHSPLFRPESLGVGPMTLHDGVLMQLDLSFLTLPLGREIGGIVGFGFLMRSVAEIDMGHATVALHDPSAYTLAAGEWSGVEITDRVPAVRASFDQGEGLFRLDTGANTALTFHAPTVERMKLLDGRATTDTMLGGVGGAIKAKAGTLAWFSIGGQRLEKLAATFALENKGAFANPDIDGNIGAGILRNFKLVFDYPHQRMAFIKH
ncbi:MAG: aspartyl protease family protein [Phycisphaerales bacterium]|jgi:hypothetical protein|nr:aspartyl protease family protein [Phycisphaerales bacterium]